MSTEVGIKRIEKGRNITIPDVIKTEPDIDLKRRTLVGDTTDSLSIRGFSGNRIMLNINGRPVNASGVVGGYYIDWGTIPLDNIEKIELIRGGSSARYGNNALGGVVNVITKKPTTDPTLTLFGTYGGGEGIHGIGNFRMTHSYKVGPLGYSLAGSYQEDALTPKLTATFQASSADTVTASVYQALRTPGLPETFWWGYGATNGEPILKPETNTAVEFLYRHDFAKRGFLRMSAYHYDVDDYIITRFTSTWKGVYNLDNAKIYGASLDGGLTFTDRISGTAAVTFQRSKKQGDIYDTVGLSDEIDYLPKWKTSASLEFKLPRKSVLNVTARYVGERSAIYAYTSGYPVQQYFKRVDLDAYITADVNFKIPLGKHTEFSCYVENLFDEEYEERYGYPMPGIIAGAALKFSL